MNHEVNLNKFVEANTLLDIFTYKLMVKLEIKRKRIFLKALLEIKISTLL